MIIGVTEAIVKLVVTVAGLGDFCHLDRLYHVLEELPKVDGLNTIHFAFSTYGLVGAGMLTELLLNELDTEGCWEQVESQEHSLELTKCQHV